jgi:hypothetical protein
MDRERRQVLKVLGYAALSVQIVPLATACAVEEHAPADQLTVHSSSNSKLGEWAAHSHLLYVPLRLFRQPPTAAVSLDTTWTFLHRHEVVLTHDQLVTVAQGGAVQVQDTQGVHGFAIRLS